MDAGDEALAYFVRRDLLGERVQSISQMWQLPEVGKLLARQQRDGSFRYPGRHQQVYPAHHYPLFETWKQFRFLVDKYGLTRKHEAAARAAEFLLSCQSAEGDIRGLLANQYATYYTGAILGLLIKAGYGHDPRVEDGMRWLLSMRQDDGGWTAPLLTVKLTRAEQMRLTTEYAEPIELDRPRPFSHNWTGMVLRAFAAHGKYRRLKAAKEAAKLLKARFFQPDCYTAYRSAAYWTKFQFPFWWNHLVAALDSLAMIGVRPDDPDIRGALDWLIEHQAADGLWNLSYDHAGKARPTTPRTESERRWVTLAICRVLKKNSA